MVVWDGGGKSRRNFEVAITGGAPLRFLLHHGSHFRDHPNKAVRESAKRARTLSWKFGHLGLGLG